MEQTKKWKAGTVALIGRPNVGKSTLMNTLIEEKISIVSDKPQTTRKRVTGILTQNHVQAIFLDAPGIVKSETGMNHFLQKEVEQVIEDADVLALILAQDEEEHSHLTELLEAFYSSKKPKFAIFTKCDLNSTSYSRLLRTDLSLNKISFVEVKALAEKKQSQNTVMELLSTLLPESEAPYYDEDEITLENLRDITGEIIREKAFECLHHELPYGLGIRIIKFDESQPQITRIYADILVEKENHKSMVIGEKGQMIKQIGIKAREDIEKLLQNKVYLELKVVFRADWTQKTQFMKEMGYGQRK